jgi:hypothetical protein
MDELLTSITGKKQRLDAMRPVSQAALLALQKSYDVDLTYRIPPVAVRPEDRKTYLDTLEQASLRDDLKPFQTFMHQRLDATLGEYLSALQEALPPNPNAINQAAHRQSHERSDWILPNCPYHVPHIE